jgi:hypothetical protein
LLARKDLLGEASQALAVADTGGRGPGRVFVPGCVPHLSLRFS